jgi:hypothetical protein
MTGAPGLDSQTWDRKNINSSRVKLTTENGQLLFAYSLITLSRAGM